MSFAVVIKVLDNDGKPFPYVKDNGIIVRIADHILKLNDQGLCNVSLKPGVYSLKVVCESTNEEIIFTNITIEKTHQHHGSL